MTLLRTATMVSTATSVSETAVTTSTMSALPAIIALVWESDFWPASLTEFSASLSMLPNDDPPSAEPAAATDGMVMVRFLSARSLRSGLEDVERALDHGAGRVDDVEVGGIGALGIAHVGHLDQRIDVGVFHIAVGVGRRVPGLVLHLEVG